MNRTQGQALVLRAVNTVQWAQTFLEESATPEALDVERLVRQVRQAFSARRAERLAARSAEGQGVPGR